MVKSGIRNWRPRGFAGYALLIIALLAVLTLTVAPFSKRVIEQWSRLDVESRSRLVSNTLRGPISRALAEDNQPRLASILKSATQDERILAVGLCDEPGVLRDATELMPRDFSCDNVARSEAESFSSIVEDGRRVLVGAFPIASRDQRVYLIVLHDLSYADTRSGEVQVFAAASIVAVVLVIAGIAAALVVLVQRSWDAALRRVVYRIRAGDKGHLSGVERHHGDEKFLRLLRDLDVGRAPTE